MLNIYDTIIVGTGVAGLFTALSLPENNKILMITKDSVKNSNSYLAQGGISCLLNDEDYEVYYADTIKAGRYKNNHHAVKEMILKSQSVVKKLIEFGVDFDRDKDLNIEYAREGGHSAFRILHSKDETGKEIIEKLLLQVNKRKNITILEHMNCLELIINERACLGILAADAKGNINKIYSKFTVLASGGIGGLFKNSTNFPHITADAIAIALNNNIKLENLNYIQIHPTALYTKEKGRKFLISEAVRGEGAVLLNKSGDRFVDELLPRDIVADAICSEMQKDKQEYVYLDFSKVHKDKINNHFPNIYRKCKEQGYDILSEPIPIAPAQHYMMGGIKTDVKARTNIFALYAVGETACNGVHGANRLASNSLLESLVFAENAANDICTTSKDSVLLNTDIDTGEYESVDINNWQNENKKRIFKEIKKEDPIFYDKWCNL